MAKLRIVIPKGRIYGNVIGLIEDAGIAVEVDERSYRPVVSNEGLEIKIMKPQNIPSLVELGSHDLGFTGYDWVKETGAEVTEVMDLGFDPVRIVAAVPQNLLNVDLHERKMVVASEYRKITESFLEKKGYDHVFLRTYGATEVFPPDDADMIVDNTSTGRTLEANNLHVLATLMESSTRLIANRAALRDPEKKEKINELKTLFQAVLDARERVMLEMNIPKGKADEIIKALPCMRSPTVAPLYGKEGYAIKVAVKRTEAAKLIPRVKKLGATDILEYNPMKVVI
ncbi:MAG: ATP phosphoribosyltransferase [Euryarchaeota archaeon]|nr:ATP phosphoribosyltransferase [Euryarchaeota archaeon]